MSSSDDFSPKDNTDARAKLEELRREIASHRTHIKPFFGVLFWECVELDGKVSPDSLGAQGLNLNLSNESDEILGTFLAHFINLWTSAQDLNAASRFVAEALQMSASELLEARTLYLAKGS